MAKLCVAEKITHLPTMIMSAIQGCRKAAIDDHKQISPMAKDLDTVIVLDTDWPVTPGYQVNSNTAFKGNRSHYGA